MTKEEVFSQLKEVLVSEFEIPAEKITLETDVFNDLELDSIDAIDLIAKMRPYLKGQVDANMFKSVRTVQDVIDILTPLT